MKNKTIGCTLLIIGTSIGAGMLALPLASGTTGFALASVVLILIWALMTYTGLLVLEVNTSQSENMDNFSSMAQTTAGPIAKILSWICVICLLYSLTWAYISGGASILNPAIKYLLNSLHLKPLPASFNTMIGASIFTLLLGITLWHSTAAVDAINRSFISLKMVFLIICMALLLPTVHNTYLSNVPQSMSTHHILSSIKLAPIFLASFGYHTVIPSLSMYHNKNHKMLKKAIIIGTSVPLILYLLWLICTLGIVPLTGKLSFAGLAHSSNSVGDFTRTLIKISNNSWVSFSIIAFTNIALVTSFLGVTLGLFDFIASVFKIPNTKSGRLLTTCITLSPPLILFTLAPNGFLTALKIAALFVILLEIILPAWMAQTLRKKKIPSNYQAPGGKSMLFFCYAIGLGLIIVTVNSLIT
jgi:tyrosine-specific transport protein